MGRRSASAPRASYKKIKVNGKKSKYDCGGKLKKQLSYVINKIWKIGYLDTLKQREPSK